MSRAIDKGFKKVDDAFDKIQRMVGLEALSRVVLKTPVDLGRARGNWNASVGNPDITTTEATDKSGISTIARGRARFQNVDAEDVLYISNGLPYIDALEHGHSKQAPNGMVMVTVAEMRPLIDQLARRFG